MRSHRRVAALTASLLGVAVWAPTATGQTKTIFWGDTHVHSNNSFDAYLNRNATVDPATAYRYAKGLPVIHPYHRARVQIETPLDFLVVSDHAEYMGVIRQIVETGIPTEDLGLVDRGRAWVTQYWFRDVVEEDVGMEAFGSFLPEEGSVEEEAASPPQSAIPGADGVLPLVGNTVDPSTARYTNDIGSPSLAATWRDPEFEASQPSFYYARILEIPTPRHSTFDALALGLDPTTLEEPVSLQERAYTSPIWYAPMPD